VAQGYRPYFRALFGTTRLLILFLQFVLHFVSGFFTVMAVISNILAPDLHYLLEDKGVDDELMEIMKKAGITTIARLSLLEDTRAGVRKALEGEPFNLDPKVGLNRIRQVCFLDAWETASTTTAEDRRQQAEAKATRLPRVLPRANHVALRRAAEAIYGELHDRIAPGAPYIESLLEQVEEGTLEAFPLSQVLCVEDGEESKTNAVIDASGVVRIKKGKLDVPLPTDTEGLRKRLRTWGMGFTFAKLKHPTRSWLKDAVPETIAEYADYLLGDTVRGLVARNDRGEAVATPSFAQILHYDYQVRKEQAKLISKGLSFKDALDNATKDHSIRERHFVTPMAVSVMAAGSGGSGNRGRDRSRSAPRHHGHRGGKPRNDKRDTGASGSWGSGASSSNKGFGKGKGSNKNVNKGRGKNRDKGKGKGHRATPDGKQICFAFNNPHEKCTGTCDRAHVCRTCLGGHPAFQCTKDH
jgi:hypothetical protein